VYLVDHPRLHRRLRRQIVTLDAAYTDERLLREALSRLLGGEPRHVVVMDLDLVRDVTKVDVRYRVARRARPSLSPTWPDRADRVAP
jgi:hypothetical protein